MAGDPSGPASAGRDQPVRNKHHMQSQARVSLSKGTLFHGVILIKQSETGVKVPVGLPASLWETDSVDGRGFPFKADCTLTEPVFKAGWDRGDPALWQQKPPFLAHATCCVDPLTSSSRLRGCSL